MGVALGKQLRAGDLVILSGSLGAGKTTLTKGIATGMGVSGRVTSPTFVIARVHRPDPDAGRAVPLVHVDAYRLAGARRAGRPRPGHRSGRGRGGRSSGARGSPSSCPSERLTIELVRLPDDTRTAELIPVGESWRVQGRPRSDRFGDRPEVLTVRSRTAASPGAAGVAAAYRRRCASTERRRRLRKRRSGLTGQSRVLVVDDDDTVREVLRRYLTRDGHEVLEAADGITGLSLVRSQQPGSAGARPDAARHGRARGLPGDPPHLDRPGDHADRAGPGIRSGGRPGVRRRRLRRQTVQPAGAGAAGGPGAGTQPRHRSPPSGRVDAGDQRRRRTVGRPGVPHRPAARRRS